MTTLRESLQAEIAEAKEEVARLEARFAMVEGSLGAILEHDVEVVKEWFLKLRDHFK